jgi:hypothetical protein
MTNPFDPFLHRHHVDVGHSFAICGFLSVAYQLFSVVGDALLGKVDINLGIPIGGIIAIGLWRHRPWARTSLLIVTWVICFILCLLVALVVLGVNVPSLTVGTTVLTHPTTIQVFVVAAMFLPIPLLSLCVLLSAKARMEFEIWKKHPL